MTSIGRNSRSKRVFSFLLALVVSVVMIFGSGYSRAYADEGNPENWEWYKYGNSLSNNSVVDRATPLSPDEAQLKWTAKIGSGWAASPTPPLISDQYLYLAINNRVIQLDKETGAETALSKKKRAPFYLNRSIGYAMNPMLYAEGKLFVAIADGSIQCVDVQTLEPLWVSRPVGGQTVSNVSYKKINGKGYVYLGTWEGETSPGTFFAVAVDDEGISEEKATVPMVNSSDKQEVTYKVKEPAWTFTPTQGDEDEPGVPKRPRGFYWSGAYVTDNYLAIGTDDGRDEGDYGPGATLFTLNPINGQVIDKVANIKGDIRTSICYDNGYLYYSTKGGDVHKTAVSAQGKLSQDSFCPVGGMTTATPLVYKNRIYIGVSGGSQFDPNSNHRFAVINNTGSLSASSIAYTQSTPGYPQATCLATSAYENEDFDTNTPGPDGRVYVYFTYNAMPGGIYAFYDLPGATEAPIKDKNQLLVFSPEKDKQQYCLSPIVADEDGTLYYKNDSGNVFAVSKGGPALQSLDLTDMQGNSLAREDGTLFRDMFHHNIREYTLTIPNIGDTVKVNATAKNNEAITVNGQQAVSGQPLEVSLNQTGATNLTVKVTKDGKSFAYTVQLRIRSASDNAKAYDIQVTGPTNTPPWKGNATYALTPPFSANQTKEMVSEPNDTIRGKTGANIWVTPEDDKAVVTAEPVDNVKGTIGKFEVAQPNNGHKAYRLRANADTLTKDVKVKITITSESGTKSQTYLVTVGRQYHVTEVALNKGALTLEKGGEETLTCTVKPAKADIQEVEWTSSNTSVATVDASGKVTGVAKGQAEIKATSKDGKKEAICQVTVYDSLAQSASIHLTIENKTALQDLKDDYGFTIPIPGSAKGKIFEGEISLTDGENLADAIKKALDGKGIAYKMDGSGGRFTELAGLKEKINISSSVIQNGGKVEGDMSGWYSAHNGLPLKTALNHMKYGSGLGQGDTALYNDDVIVLHYAVDGVTFDKEYKQSFALDPAIKNIELTAGDTYTVPADKISVEPANWLWGRQYGQYFCMSDKEAVATVTNDDTGIKIQAKSQGTATIDIELPNELGDTIQVTVKPKTQEKPEPRLLIDGNVWDSSKTFETDSAGPHSLKVQVKKNGAYVDVDPSKITWDITNGATSRVWKQAFWITVDQEATFKATLEEYPDEQVSFKAKLKQVTMTDFTVQLPTTYKIGAWNNLEGSWSSKTGGSYFIGIIEGEGTDNYKIIPTPGNATNTEVTWEALTPEIATYMEYFKNGIVPVKAGTAKFKVTSKANPNLSKIVEVPLEYRYPLQSVSVKEEEIVMRKGETRSDLGFLFQPENASEQRFDWTFSEEGIVDYEEIVESTGNTHDLPSFIHKLTAIEEGTVVATATPWDTTGGAKPVKLTIHVIGDMAIHADETENAESNIGIVNDYVTYTKGTSSQIVYTVKNGILSRLQSVQVDGEELAETDYDKKAGSIILTLKKSYLDTLAAGRHKLKVTTQDGTLETEFEIKEAPAKYQVKHRFVSNNQGMILPEAVMQELPSDITDLATGATVVPKAPEHTEIEVQGGRWVFAGWKPAECTIEDRDEEFVGSWDFLPNPTEADQYNPTSDPLEVEFGQAVTEDMIKAAVKGLPPTANLAIEGKLPDGTEAGIKEVQVTVTYADQSQDQLTVTVSVKDKPAASGQNGTAGQNGTSGKSINTGDRNGLFAYIFLAGAGALVLLFALRNRKKTSR